MDLTTQQQIEDKNYQYSSQLEALQAAQEENKKTRRWLETLQEQFYQVQQQENQLYQQSLNEVEPAERAFFEERLSEGAQLSSKALQEFEDKQEQLQQDGRILLENEAAVRAAQRAFLTSEGEGDGSGA